MKPILETRSKWQQVRALGRRGAVVLSLLLGLGVAQADTTNFVGDFAPGEPLWTMLPDRGSVNFANGDTELILAGPNQPLSNITNSLDGILYNGPLPGGLRVGGTVQFQWSYTPGAVDGAEADITWLPPGGGSPIQSFLVNNGGLGADSGFFSTNMLAGTTFEISLTTTTELGKLSGTLTITDFQFHDVPEPSTGALLASAVISLCATRRHTGRRRASVQA
jgi:hypothetical protein